MYLSLSYLLGLKCVRLRVLAQARAADGCERESRLEARHVLHDDGVAGDHLHHTSEGLLRNLERRDTGGVM